MRHTISFTGLILTCVIIAAASFVQADDWPQWGGRNRDGKSADTGLLAQWPTGGPHLAWKATGFGKGYSTIAVVGDHLYTMGDKDNGGWLIAASTDGRQGSASPPRWAPPERRLCPATDFPGPRSTPTVDGDLIVALNAWGQLICVNAADGKVMWQKYTLKDFGGSPPTWGYAESPLIDGDSGGCQRRAGRRAQWSR